MHIWRRIMTFVAAGFFLIGGSAFAQTCGTTTWQLTAGQTIPVGTVTVSNDLNNLYITYALDPVSQPGATFGTLHAWVGTDLLNVPSVKNGPNKGTPIPGQFPYKPDATGQTTYTLTIPFLDLLIQDANGACGQPLYVVTHAEVNGVDSDGDGNADGGQTAFGGPTGVNIAEPGRWWYYGIYTVCCDFGPPPIEACTTAFGKGSHVWTTDRKSNPENLPSLSLTKNRWGWALNLGGPGTYVNTLWMGAGLNNTGKGTNVGTVTVSWDGATATVTYTLSAGYVFKEAHAYIDDGAPDTIAPGQYGNTAYMDGSETSYTFTASLSDVDGIPGAWVVAHAVVCR